MSTVLVTGGSGFIGGFCILLLLEQGHTVRTTVRNLAREGEVRATLRANGAAADAPLTFFAANLEKDAGWAEAVAGCDYVLHVASPFPDAPPKHEDDLIVPAREGALRVLRAARDAGVKRVVLTSSFAAIGYGQKQMGRPFDERDWTIPDGDDTTAYAKSKTLAERAAWDFIAKEGGALELSVVNPVGVFGPLLGADYSTSILLVKRLMDGDFPGTPKLLFGAVDVRDVADLHLRAMTDPKAKGERFLALAGDFISMHDIAMILKKRLGADAARVPTRVLPNWAVRLVAMFDPAARLITPELGKSKNGTNAKARTLLGWQPRTNEECVAATGESLVRLGLLKGQTKKAA
ncbi:MAG TPA: aldehyde reductase [Rhizomicrobium sp.]|jgi:dihydroflavonol-4-reductase|nr:aldehyde reductase [Rhizomicrobium sp.]